MERSPRYAIYSDILASFLASVNTNKLFVEQIYKGVSVFSRVAYRGGSSHFFGFSILRYLICSVSVFFGQYSRCVGKISSFMVPPSKNIYYP